MINYIELFRQYVENYKPLGDILDTQVPFLSTLDIIAKDDTVARERYVEYLEQYLNIKTVENKTIQDNFYFWRVIALKDMIKCGYVVPSFYDYDEDDEERKIIKDIINNIRPKIFEVLAYDKNYLLDFLMTALLTDTVSNIDTDRYYKNMYYIIFDMYNLEDKLMTVDKYTDAYGRKFRHLKYETPLDIILLLHYWAQDVDFNTLNSLTA